MIDVRIPYSTERNLGDAYNRAIQSSESNWVLLLDHDVFLALSPRWYEICIHTISKHNPALASCWTCKTGSALPWIAYQDSPDSTDIQDHVQTAQRIYNQYQMSVTEIEKVTGFFMLINKSVWKSVGGFPAKGISQEDWDYSKKLTDAGHKIFRMDGMYVYHHKARSWLKTKE